VDNTTVHPETNLHPVDIQDLPAAFQRYRWEKKHALYGFEADCYPNFPWINSLETRFAWVRNRPNEEFEAPIFLLREMIQWGGSQNGVLQKFDENLGGICLDSALWKVIEALDRPEDAIRAALDIPAFGLTYASKLLRFLDPVRYAALDSQIRKLLKPKVGFPTIYDANTNSMVAGYLAFLEVLDGMRDEAQKAKVVRPECKLAAAQGETEGWRNADIEMALFARS
jgi:hypothetical protein